MKPNETVVNFRLPITERQILKRHCRRTGEDDVSKFLRRLIRAEIPELRRVYGRTISSRNTL